MEMDQLVQHAAGLLRRDRRVVLGITGCPGAGKSTLAERLVGELDTPSRSAVHVPMDGFHLADVALDLLGRRQRKGAVDTFDGFGYLALLRLLHSERQNTVYAPGFARTIEQPVAASILVTPSTELVITEGNYLLIDDEPWPQVRAELTEVWYCDLDSEPRRRRLIARHIQFGKTESEASRWVESVDDPNARLVESTRNRADLVIDMRRLE
jgi:pantothenate kinase